MTSRVLTAPGPWVLAVLALAAPAAAETPGSIEIEAGPDAQTLVRGDDTLTAWPVGPGSVPLAVSVDGPTWFEVTVHRLADGGTGSSRIAVMLERDATAQSLTERTLPPAPRAVSAPPVQLRLDEGRHHLTITVVGDDTVPLVVTIDTTQRGTRALAASPEEPALSALGGPALVPLVQSNAALGGATGAPPPEDTPDDVAVAESLELPALDTRPEPRAQGAPRPPTIMPRPRVRPTPPTVEPPPPSPEAVGEDWSGRAPGAGGALGLGLRAGVSRPSSAVDVAPLLSLELRWHPNRARSVLGVTLEGGWRSTRGAGVARGSSPRAAGTTYSWRTTDVPLSLGVVVVPPFAAWSDGWPAWLAFHLGAGGMLQLTSRSSEAGGVSSSGSSRAYGGYGSAGTEFLLGWRHRLQLEYRHTLLRTTFGDSTRNPDGGDVGGPSVVAGYRFLFY